MPCNHQYPVNQPVLIPDHKNSFKTLSGSAGPFLLKEKKSKFLGFCFHASTESDVDSILLELRKTYSDASHVCYAYHLGANKDSKIRMNDDGEPAYTAGGPIYGQIKAAELVNVLVAVVRYYGGTKLGAGGLTQAYRETAKGVLQLAPVITKKATCLLRLEFDYPSMDKVMSFISQNRLEIKSQQMGLDCVFELFVPIEKSKSLIQRLGTIPDVQIGVKEVFR